MRIPASVLFLISVGAVTPAAGQAALNYREDLPHQMMVGSMPSPTPCDVRINQGIHDENCLWDPRYHHYMDVKDDPGKRKALEKANETLGPQCKLVGYDFGRPGFCRLPDKEPPKSTK